MLGSEGSSLRDEDKISIKFNNYVETFIFKKSIILLTPYILVERKVLLIISYNRWVIY